MSAKPATRNPGTKSRATRGPSPVTLALRCSHPGWKPLAPRRRVILDAIRAALEAPPVKPLAGAELSILLTGDEEIRTINAAWRGQDKATNVLSFPAAPPGRISASPVLGDIALAYETLAREAQEQDKPLDAHLAHLVIHGLYHLLGDDHETQAEAEVMEAREIAALARLGLDNPYHEPLDAARAS